MDGTVSIEFAPKNKKTDTKKSVPNSLVFYKNQVKTVKVTFICEKFNGTSLQISCSTKKNTLKCEVV